MHLWHWNLRIIRKHWKGKWRTRTEREDAEAPGWSHGWALPRTGVSHPSFFPFGIWIWTPILAHAKPLNYSIPLLFVRVWRHGWKVVTPSNRPPWVPVLGSCPRLGHHACLPAPAIGIQNGEGRRWVASAQGFWEILGSSMNCHSVQHTVQGEASIALGPRAHPDWEQRHAYSFLRVQGNVSTYMGNHGISFIEFLHVSFTVLKTTSQNELLTQHYEKKELKPECYCFELLYHLYNLRTNNSPMFLMKLWALKII